MIQTYDMEPELQSRAPRQVRLARPQYMYRFWFGRVFLLPFIYIGVKTIWQATQSGIGILAYTMPRYAQTWEWPLAWSAIVGLMTACVWAEPALRRNLIVNGTPAVGTITGKSQGDDDGTTTFNLTYTFTPESSATEIFAQMRVTKEEWLAVSNTERYTVLYLPSNPRRNTLYPFSPYIAVG